MDKETIFKVIVFAACSIPLWIHILNDARGDRKKGNDIIVLSAVAGVLALVFNKFLHIRWDKTLPVMFGWHFLIFDYYVVKQLIKNEVIDPLADWFSYMGKSSWVDNIPFWRNMHPAFRFMIREAVFIAASLYFWL